jgi:nuclear GTP-binding protein
LQASLKEEQRQKRIKMRAEKKKRSLAELAHSAQADGEAYEAKEATRQKEAEKRESVAKEESTKGFYKEFKKVVEAADIILEVLDARDPMGCRCPEIEQQILAQDPNKRIILILNKVDLVPRENAEAWLKRLRNEFPTIVFKCNTQDQRRNLGQRGSAGGASAGRRGKGGNKRPAPGGNPLIPTWAPDDVLQSSESLGANALIQLIKNYSRNNKIKTALTIGVIGYPNVGKSSLINSLKRTKSATVGAMPGVTKTMQEISIDSKIRILDCPGIIFSCGDSDADLILRNAAKVQKLIDPIVPVQGIINRCAKSQLLEVYEIPDFDTVEEFLFFVAQRKGRLLKGGVPDIATAGRLVLQDWNSGKIPFFTVPPQDNPRTHVASAIVADWAQAFDLASVDVTVTHRMLTDLDTVTKDKAYMQIESAQVKAVDMFDESKVETAFLAQVIEDEDTWGVGGGGTNKIKIKKKE